MTAVDRAKALLLSLERRRDKTLPLAPQLTKLFIPTLCTRGVVATNSLHGRFVRLLNGNASQTSQTKLIYRTFAHALAILHKQTKDGAEIALPVLVELNQLLRTKEIEYLESSITIGDHSSEELRSLHAAVKENHQNVVVHRAAETRRLSFLRATNKHQTISIEQLSELFSIEPVKYIRRLFHFLQHNTNHAHKRLQYFFSQWEQAQTFREKLLHLFTSDTALQKDEQRQKKIAEVAATMSKEVHTLQSDQTWMYCGSYGRTISPMESLLILFSRLPEGTWDHFSASVRDIVQKGKMPDSSKLITEALQMAVSEASKQLPDAERFFGDPFVRSLLENESRELTGLITRIVPQCVKTGLESWLKQGLIGNVAEFVPDGETREWMLWFAEIGKELQDPKKREKCLQSMMAKATSMLQKPVDDASKTINGIMQNFIAALQNNLPDLVMNISGLDSSLQSGQFWLEFVRQKNGKFTLLVYASGNALKHHPHDAEGRVQWPLKICDIDPRFVNPEFFQRALSHFLEPMFNEHYLPRSQDLYEGLLRYLQGSVEPSKSDWRQFDVQMNSEAEFMTCLMENPQGMPGLAAFQMRFEALVGFCKSRLYDDQLVFQRIDEVHVLEEIVKKLQKEKSRLFAVLKDAETEQRVDATLQEIQLALDAFVGRKTDISLRSETTKIPKLDSKVFREFIQTNRTSLQHLRSARSTLVWALGEEFGELIDSLTDSGDAEVVAKQAVEKPTYIQHKPLSTTSESTLTINKAPQGWLRTILFHVYFQMAIKVLQTLMLFSRLYAIGIGTLVKPYIADAISQMIPQFLYDWYTEVVAAMYRMFVELTLKIIFRTLLSKEDAEKLTLFANSCKGSLHSWTKAVSGSGALQLALDRPLSRAPQTAFSKLEHATLLSHASANSIATDRYAVWEQFNVEKISQEQLTQTLERWHKELVSLRDNSALDYFVEQSFRLPFPHSGMDPFWDKISPDSIMNCIESLSAFSMSVNCTQIKHEKYGNFLAAQGTVLAIIDKLARRIPEAQINGYHLDIYPLLHWLKQRPSIIDNGRIAQRLSEICAYFFPEIDLDEMPSANELYERAKSALFNYAFTEQSYFSRVAYHRHRESDVHLKPRDDVINSREFHYLKERFSDPAMKKQLSALGIIIDDLSEIEKFSLFLQASSSFSKDKAAILPRSYVFLRLQTLYFKHICRPETSFFDQGAFRDLVVPEPASLELLKKREMSQRDLFVIKPTYIFFIKILTLLNAYDDFLFASTDKTGALTQSETMVKYRDSTPKVLLWELKECEHSDRIVRLFAFFQSWKEEIKHLSDEFEGLFFNSIWLQRQLAASPQIALAFGEAITAWIKYHEKSDAQVLFNILHFGIKLKNYCQHCSPEYVSTFPDFRKLLLDKINFLNPTDVIQQAERARLYALYAMTFRNGESNDWHRAVLTTCQALFLLNGSHPNLITELKYESLLPMVKKLLQDEKFANELIHSIFLILQIPIDPSKKWIPSASAEHQGLLFQSGDATIDFLHLTMNNAVYGKRFRTAQIETALQKLVGQRVALQSITEDRFESSDKQFFVETRGDLSVFSRLFEGRRYEHIELRIDDPLRYHLNVKVTDGCTFWLETTQTNQKELLVFQRHQLFKRIQVEAHPTEKHSFILTGNGNNAPSHCVSGEVLRNELAPLRRFCPLKNVQCWIKSGSTTIEKIVIDRFNLEFTTALEHDELSAICRHQAIPGYAIASKQQCEQLNGFSSYLLLKNSGNEFKVIMPKSQWGSSLLWQFLNYLGPAAANISKLFPIYEEESTSFYVYDFEPKSGRLTSDDPEALAYLLSQYILQRDILSAEVVCSEFLMLAKRKCLPEHILRLLIPLLLLPAGIENIGFIRSRLMAAIEENRLVQMRDTADRTLNADLLINLSAIAMTVIDLQQNLQEKDPRKRLRADQEWFLFKSIFSKIRGMIDQIDSDFIKNRIKAVGIESVIETIGLPPVLAHRYQQLKEEFGKNDSLILRTVRFANRVLHSDSILSTVTNPLGTIRGELPSHSAKKEMLELANLLGSHILVDSKKIDVFKLRNECCLPDLDAVPLEIEKITPETIRKHFLSFYTIARNEGKPGQYERLKRILPLLKGGWDTTTRVLILYLEAIAETPSLFWSIKDVVPLLQKKSSIEEQNMIITKWKEFFEHLHFRFICREAIVGGISLTGNIAINTFVSTQVLGMILPVISAAQSPFLLSSTLNIGAKLFTAIATPTLPSHTSTDSNKSQSLIVPEANLFLGLLREDQKIDAAFDVLFSTAFEEVSPNLVLDESDRKESVSFFPNDESDREQINRINQSIKDYYTRPDRIPTFLRFKGKKAISELYLSLNASCSTFRKQMKREKTLLLDSVNIGKNKDFVSWHDLLHFFLKGNYETFAKITHVPVGSFSKIEKAIARYLVRYTRLQQMERALRYLEELTLIDPAKQHQAYEQKVQQLAEELKARRTYPFNISPQLVRRFMLFEMHTDKMLWAKQSTCMQQLLLKEQGDVVVELLMSFGKTYFAIPTMTSYFGTTFNIWPKSLVETNTKQLSRQSHDIFHQSTNVIRFSRGMKLDKDTLEAIAMVMHRAETEKESINGIKESYQAIELLFIEKLYNLAHGHRPSTPEEKETLLFLCGLLQSLKKGKAIGDEFHELINDKQKLNHPLGARKSVKMSLYRIIETCFRKILELPNVEVLIKGNQINKVHDLFVSILSTHLATELCHTFGIQESLRKEFLAYVTGKSETVPEWISKNSRYSEIAIAKGMITVLLPLAFSRRVSVDFGDSLAGNGEYARPYDGNSSPLEDASIQSPYEAIVKTLLMLLVKNLNMKQAEKVITLLLAKAKKETKRRNIDFGATSAAIFFKKIVQHDLNAFETLNESHKAEALKKLAKNTEVIFFYMRNFLLKEIKYWEKNTCSDSQNFASMFGSQIHDTGTPFNDGTYPANLKMLWDPGTIGEALHILTKKCPKDGIHILQKNAPEEALEEVLNRFFTPDSNFTAIIDGDPQFHGLSNEHVARKIADYCRRRRPDIKAIDFFKRNPRTGLDELMTLPINENHSDPVAYEQCKVPLEARIAYFDQVHGFGANIPQKFNGKALILLGSKHMLFRLLQEAFRMRGVKIFKRLLEGQSFHKEWDALNLKETQTIHFAMTKEVRETISGRDMPTLEQITLHTAKNESALCKQQNYDSYRKKVVNVIRAAILTKIYSAESLEEQIHLWHKFEFMQLLVSTYKDDPKDIYGPIETLIPTSEAIALIKKQAMALMLRSEAFEKNEQIAITSRIEKIPLPPMPDKVKRFIDAKGNSRFDLLDDLHGEVNNDVENEDDVDRENDNENDNENELNVHVQRCKYPFKEFGWEKTDSQSLTWLKFQTPHRHSFLSKHLSRVSASFSWSSKCDEDGTPPLFRVRDLLAHSSNPALRKVARAFDSRLWASNNSVLQAIRSVNENSIEVCSNEQRELFEVLVHFNDNHDVIAMGCLSQHDAALWRHKLKQKEAAKKSSMHVVVYDTVLRAPVTGHSAQLTALRTKMVALETEAKFFNGDVNSPHTQHLKEWMRKFGAKDMSDAFFSIHAQRGKRPIAGSEMDGVMTELNGVSIEEAL